MPWYIGYFFITARKPRFWMCSECLNLRRISSLVNALSTCWRIIAPCLISCLYCHLGLIMFILPLGAYHVYTATWGPFIFVTISWRSQVFTGINITRIRKRAVLRTFLFIKIASLQYDCVLQNTIKSHCSSWGEYLQISFMPHCFCSRII